VITTVLVAATIVLVCLVALDNIRLHREIRVLYRVREKAETLNLQRDHLIRLNSQVLAEVQKLTTTMCREIDLLEGKQANQQHYNRVFLERLGLSPQPEQTLN
jgi:adenosylmethionine-8-amino-7-oxononanoate aminotransferase